MWLIASALSLCCGRVGPPLPPIRRFPVRVEKLAVAQRGNTILLTFPHPDVSALQAQRFQLERIDVYRLIEEPAAAGTLSQEEFAARASVIGSISAGQIARVPATQETSFQDSPISSFRGRYLYAVCYVNNRGRTGLPSDIMSIEPHGKVALPPTSTTAEDQAQDVILITWAPPEQDIDGSRPANVVGFNLYRKRANEDHFTGPINGSAPVTGSEFLDRDFEYGAQYTYLIRSVSAIAGSEVTESNDSEPITFTPHDTFPPAPPEGLTAASANGVINLFWTANAEPDLAGYNIYRAESPDAAEARWVKLSAAIYTLTTFHDEHVQPGKRYYYRITAVDRAGNEGRSSAIISQEAL